MWNTKKPSLHSDESLVRRPRLGKNGADFSEQVKVRFQSPRLDFLLLFVVVLVFVVKVVLLLLVLSHIFLVAHTLFGRCFVVDVDVFIKYFSGGIQVY